jgi:hypothetical protein
MLGRIVSSIFERNLIAKHICKLCIVRNLYLFVMYVYACMYMCIYVYICMYVCMHEICEIYMCTEEVQFPENQMHLILHLGDLGKTRF